MGQLLSRQPRPGRRRARKVHRVVRHVDPWSVLKVAFFFSLSAFLVVCVASALLWGAARASGTVERVESFITSLGGFGSCEPTDGTTTTTTTTTTVPEGTDSDPTGIDDTGVPPLDEPSRPDDDGDCSPGTELVGGFEFEDARVLQSFALGGLVMVLAGSALSAVAAVLFNLISGLTGGVRITVLEEERSD